MEKTSEKTREPAHPRVSVVIVSWRRPDYVKSCLGHLAQLEPPPDEVVVVDASPDDLTAAVVRDFPWALRVPFAGGAGHMTTSRNVGLLHVTGDIVAFIDDDANVRAGWLLGLLHAYADPKVGAVAGRTCNGLPDEESEGAAAIGRVLPNGELTGNFAADPGAVTEVDHGIGANMSFRREVLARLGGFRNDFLGVELREDADIFLRLRALGYRAIFSPAAVVDHVGAPHVKGRRFDYRYAFWARRNHALLLARSFGLGSSQFRTWVVDELGRAAGASHPSPLRRTVRIAMGVAGVLAGIVVSLRKARWGATDPVRRDPTGEQIRQRLFSLEKSSAVRINAYVLAADPTFLGASVQSYYDAVDRIVVSYDENHRSWSGKPIPVDECLAELRHIDRGEKLDFRSGRYSHPELPPMDCETRQRQAALLAAAEDADWILQLDGDEVIPDLSVFVEMLARADAASADGLDFPSRWLYARTRDGRFLEGCSRWWRAAAGYPGPLAVRAGTVLKHARQCNGQLFRVDFRPRNTDPWRLADHPVDATVPVDAGVLHLSWVRTPEQMADKATISGHQDHVDWQAGIRKWRRRQRHPRITVALTPLRRRGLLHPSWLRLVRLPVDPLSSVLPGGANRLGVPLSNH